MLVRAANSLQSPLLRSSSSPGSRCLGRALIIANRWCGKACDTGMWAALAQLGTGVCRCQLRFPILCWRPAMSINPFRSALQTLADLAETDGDYEKWLPILVDGSLDALPQFDHASITIRRSGDPLETIAATSERARQGDQLQRALCEGPCYDAALEEGFRFSPRVRNDPNWPRYWPKVADLGIVSHLALHLNMAHGPRASLNLYAEQMVDADPDMLEIADLFAASMSNLLGLVRTVDQLQTGLGTNRTIGQAVGIMVERFHIPPGKGTCLPGPTLTRSQHQARYRCPADRRRRRKRQICY